MRLPTLEQSESLATSRSDSHFKEDLERLQPEMLDMLRGARVLVVGGAGSIGSATARMLSRYPVDHLCVVDIDENGLADLIRSVRGHLKPGTNLSMRTIPMDYGGALMERFLRSSEGSFDYVFNFAALKHVRSEKDIYSLLRMLETNVIKQQRFAAWLQSAGGKGRYYSVSTDKAANPVSLMGASKRIMEEVLFRSPLERHVSCARFANVAFSQGSLLNSWYDRISEGKPIPVPENIRRFFISSAEAAQICILTSLFGHDRHVAIPKADASLRPILLTDVAMAWVEALGFEPVPVLHDDAEAFARVESDMDAGRYPVLITPSDTDGEKEEEEFIGEGEIPVASRLERLQVLDTVRLPESALDDLLSEVGTALDDPGYDLSKDGIVERLAAMLPGFAHISTGKSLDNKF